MSSCLTYALDYIEINQDKKIANDDINAAEDDRVMLKDIFKGDLYVVGQVWIKGLQKALTGANVNILPVVHAAKPQDAPQRPPKMKCSDLPLYKSPHYEYKDYEEDKLKCSEANVKLLHRFLLPYVKSNRQILNQNLCSIKCTIDKTLVNICASIRGAKNDFKHTMRDPSNLALRQGVVAVGTFGGYLIGGGGGIPRRVFFTSVGFLSTGALCFPKETDELFRTFAYCVGTALLAVYNNTCGKDVNLREKIPCSDELPPPGPQRKPIQCPPKK